MRDWVVLLVHMLVVRSLVKMPSPLGLRLWGCLFTVTLLPLCLADSSSSFRFTVPGNECSLITTAGNDQNTAFVGAFYAADGGIANRCVAVAGPQVLVVASGGDPGSTSSKLLVPTRVVSLINRRLLSLTESPQKLGGLLKSFLGLNLLPAPLLTSYVGPITQGESASEASSYGGEEKRVMLQSGSAPESYFTCPLLPAANWNVSSGPFPDIKTLPLSPINGSFLLSAGCQNYARSTLFLYNRCQNDIPLVFQVYQGTTDYCDLYNFQRYFSNTLFVRVIIMVGGVLACVLVVFSLGCLIGICRSRRLARARRRRNLSRLTSQLVANRGQNLLRFGGLSRSVEVPMYEVNLDPSKESSEEGVQVVGKDGRALIVVIQPGMTENPSVETLATSGAISIATEDVRLTSRPWGDEAQGAESESRGGGSIELHNISSLGGAGEPEGDRGLLSTPSEEVR